MITTVELLRLSKATGEALRPTQEELEFFLNSERTRHNGGFGTSSSAQKRREYLLRLIHGASILGGDGAKVKAFQATLKAVQQWCKKHDCLNPTGSWNGTSHEDSPRILIGGKEELIKSEFLWTPEERTSHKCAKLWGALIRAFPEVENKIPLEAPKVETKPAPKAKQEVKPAPKAEPAPKAQDFKAVIAAMKKAGVPAELILKTLESL